MLENNIDGVIDETFTSEIDAFGKKQTVELKENGANIAVTNANKDEYVRLLCEHILTKAIDKQIEAFLKGFRELIPHELISIFNEHELELLICGLPDIDVADLKANTDYRGWASAAEALQSSTVQWFWQIVSELDQQEKALLVLL